MIIRDLESTFVTEEASRFYASRQLLLFLSAPEEQHGQQHGSAKQRATRDALLPFDKIPADAFSGGKELFSWTTRLIYDIDNQLLFRDHTFSLGPGEEVHVRTAASELLRSPVWSVRAGPKVKMDQLIETVLSFIEKTEDLVPVVGHETTPRLICYSYPKLGILCRSKKRPGARFIVDLWEHNEISASFDGVDAPLEYVKTVWSPYDHVERGKRAHLREGFGDDVTSLPRLPERIEDIIEAIEEAVGTIEEWKVTDPKLELETQQTDYFCAAATAKMILDFYGIRTVTANELTQEQIYLQMGSGETGALPKDQVNAIPVLARNALTAELDIDPAFEEAVREIRNKRPFKTGTVGHARACCGFILEVSGKQWLYIYDPYPPNLGGVYYEVWEIGHYLNYMFVQRASP
jgi:hypothetical protein